MVEGKYTAQEVLAETGIKDVDFEQTRVNIGGLRIRSANQLVHVSAGTLEIIAAGENKKVEVKTSEEDFVSKGARVALAERGQRANVKTDEVQTAKLAKASEPAEV